MVGLLRNISLVVAVAVCGFAALAVSADAANFTWSGAAAVGEPRWSNGTNWAGTAPIGSVGTLTFPVLSSAACTPFPKATCYTSENDISGLSVTALTIEGAGYRLSGAPIKLGAGGISAKPPSEGEPTVITLPIALSAAQTWSLSEGGGRPLVMENTVTGSSVALTLALGNGARLQVGEGASSADVETGPIKVGGSGVFVPVFLGQQELEPAKRAAGSFNGSDGNSVTVEGQDFLVGLNGTTGPLVAQEHSTIQVGAFYAGTLSVKGPLTVRGKLQQAITHSGTLAGTDYAQLSATEEITLESGTFELFDSPCTPLTVGDIDTLVTTGGALKGTFQGIPNGAVVTVRCLLGGTSPTVRINYTAKTVTATVLTSGGGTPPTVTKVSPTKGPVGGGTSVTITGTNFAGVTAVKFGSTSAASFKVNSASSITAVSPAEAAGNVDVTVTTSGGTSVVSSKDHFQFTPTVSKLSPTTGSKAGGTKATITGTGFALGKTATTFKFGSAPSTVVNCTSATKCTVTTPAHAAGKVDVKATVNKVSSPKTSADQFTYV